MNVTPTPYEPPDQILGKRSPSENERPETPPSQKYKPTKDSTHPIEIGTDIINATFRGDADTLQGDLLHLSRMTTRAGAVRVLNDPAYYKIQDGVYVVSNEKEGQKTTPLSIAMKKAGNISLVALLTRFGAHKDFTRIMIEALVNGDMKTFDTCFAYLKQLPPNDRAEIVNGVSYFSFNSAHRLIPTGNKGDIAFTLLTAAIAKNPRLAIQLINLPEDVSKININQTVPQYPHNALHHAAFLNDIEILKALQKRGVDISVKDPTKRNVLTSHTLLISPEQVLDQLRSMGFDSRVTEDDIARIELAEIWGIDDSKWESMSRLTGDHTRLCAIPRAYSTKMARDYFMQFYQEVDLKILPDSWCENISKIPWAFNVSETFDAAHQRYENGDPVILQGGYTGHNVSFAIYYDVVGGEKKEYVAFCNRGPGQVEQNTSSIKFLLPPSGFTKDFYDDLVFNYPDAKSYVSFIHDLHLTRTEVFLQKGQKNPNCGWTSPEAAIYTVLFSMFDSEVAHCVYKMFTDFSRSASYNNYIEMKMTQLKNYHHNLNVYRDALFKSSEEGPSSPLPPLPLEKDHLENITVLANYDKALRQYSIDIAHSKSKPTLLPPSPPPPPDIMLLSSVYKKQAKRQLTSESLDLLLFMAVAKATSKRWEDTSPFINEDSNDLDFKLKDVSDIIFHADPDDSLWDVDL